MINDTTRNLSSGLAREQRVLTTSLFNLIPSRFRGFNNTTTTSSREFHHSSSLSCPNNNFIVVHSIASLPLNLLELFWTLPLTRSDKRAIKKPKGKFASFSLTKELNSEANCSPTIITDCSDEFILIRFYGHEKLQWRRAIVSPCWRAHKRDWNYHNANVFRTLLPAFARRRSSTSWMPSWPFLLPSTTDAARNKRSLWKFMKVHSSKQECSQSRGDSKERFLH